MKTPRFAFFLNSQFPPLSVRLTCRQSRPRKFEDIVCNVLFPLALGVITYLTSLETVLPGLVRNHLADGLWAYAFASCLLIIWDREIRIGWMLVMLISAIGFEVMQSFDIVPGTGDWLDVFTYLLLFTLCFWANPFFRRLFYKYKS